MRVYNYVKALGEFANSQQHIRVQMDPKDRATSRMLAAASSLNQAGKEPVPFQMEGDHVLVPLRYLQGGLTRLAGVGSNASIHDGVRELWEVFQEYRVETTREVGPLVFKGWCWAEAQGQNPKVLLHGVDSDNEPVCVRFEASGELAQKALHAALALGMVVGSTVSLTVEAVDPAIGRNAKGGHLPLGKYVNHNLRLVTGGLSHSGHPPKGQRFAKLNNEDLKGLFRQAKNAELA